MGNIKGSVIVELVKVVQDSGVTPPTRLHDYFRDRVVVTDWYSDADFVELLRAAARAMGGERREAYDALGRLLARRHFEGIYRAMIRPESVERTLRGVPVLWKMQHDTGQIELPVLEDSYAWLELSGSTLVAFEACSVMGAYLAAMVELCGAQDVAVAHGPCRARGGDRCAWKVAWRPSRSGA